MSENITDNDLFINTYIKKQEEYSIKLIREKLELETKLQLLQTAYVEKSNEKIRTDELLNQSVTSITALTSDRDELKQEIGQLKLDHESTKVYSNQQIELFRSKCEELQRSFHDELQKNKKLETMLTEYDTMKSNYEVVKKVNEELQESLQVLNGDKVKKKKVDKENIN
jgi:hypothetical protein